MLEATIQRTRRARGRRQVLARCSWRRASAVLAVLAAAASLAVVSPPATGPVEAQPVPLDASCAELNTMVGRPTHTYIARQGVTFGYDAAQHIGPGSDNRYSTGETVRIQARFNLNVRWESRSDLDAGARPVLFEFMLGNVKKEAVATPAKGAGTNIVAFDYELVSTDTSVAASDVWIPEDSLRANDRAFKFGIGSDINDRGDGAAHQSISGPCGRADVAHPAVFHPQTIGSPTIVSRPTIVSEPLDGHTYYEGEKIWVQVEYSEPVRVTSGRPLLKLRFGSDTDTNPTYKNAAYVVASTADPDSISNPLPHPPNMDPRRRSSKTRLLFEYVVQSGDADADGISIDWGDLSGGAIGAMDNGVPATRHHDGLAARADYDARDGGDPTVAKHFVDGSRAPFDLDDPADPLRSTLVKAGTPAFVVSYSTRVVSYPASGTTLMSGEYIVVRAEFSEAVVVTDDRLELPIQLFNCFGADFDHRTTLDNTDQGADGKTDRERYDEGLTKVGCLDADGNEVDPETATDEHGNLKHVRYAKYFAGSGHTRLLFWYRITSQDQDRDGIIVPDGENTGEFTYDGGQEITSGNIDSVITAADAEPVHTHFSDVFEKPLYYQRADGQAVEGPPVIEAIEITSDPDDGVNGDADPVGTYELSDTITIKITYDQAVYVTGEPKLEIDIAGDPKDAVYTSGSGTALLFFSYTIEAGDEDANGISIGRDKLKSNDGTNGTITEVDEDQADASLDHNALGNQPGHKVDAKAPAITGLSIASSPPNGGTYYGSGSVIEFKVTYDEPVRVSGAPTLDFELGTATRTATYTQAPGYVHSDGTRELIFAYTVSAPDADADGVRVPAPGPSDDGITGGTIEGAGSPALPGDRDFGEFRAGSGHKVETVAPSVDAIEFVTTGLDCDASTVLVGEFICVAVTFDTDDDAGDTNDDGDVPAGGSSADRAIWVDATSGVPSIELSIDGASGKSAEYYSGSGTGNRLVFRYEVEPGLTDSDGVTVDAGDIDLNGGTISDTAGNHAQRQHDAIDTGGPIVDSVVPHASNLRITSSPPNGGDTYGSGDEISFAVDFDEDVTISGTPRLRFQIGDDTVTPANNNRNTQRAELSAGCAEADTGTCSLTFSYTVGANDDDNDGISVELDGTLTPPESTAISGTITDRTGNPADLAHGALGDNGSHKVDAQPPRVSTVEIISVGQQHNGTYKRGDAIIVRVTFDDPIELVLDDSDSDVDDNPQIALRIGSGTKYADYESRGTPPNDSWLIFRYTVEGDDLDPDGIGINANALRLQDATLMDPQGQPATLTHPSVADALNQKVDGIAPTVRGVEIHSDPPRTEAPYGNDKYGVHDATSNDYPIQVKVTFSEPVQLSSDSSIELTIGTQIAEAVWVEPDGYSTTAGISEAVFEYEVLTSDENDTDGISITFDTTASPPETTAISGTITDLVGNDADLAHAMIADDSEHQVDTTAPTISTVDITSPSPEGNSGYEDTYARGDVIMVTVTFSEKVAVNGIGTPKLELDIGGTTEEASFQPGDGMTNGDNTAKLVFTYVVATGDEDTDGVSIDAGSVVLNGSTITDLAGNNAVLTHDAVADDAEHKVDGSLTPRGPYATTIALFDGPDKLGTYRSGEHIFFDVMFSESVTVSGTPMLPIVVGNAKEASLISRPDTSTLRFRYTVQDGDEDTDGVSVEPTSIDLNGGTIRATTGNENALLGVPELDMQTGHQVDGVAPGVVGRPSITSDPDDGVNGDGDPPDTYEKDDVIEVTVEFDESVIVSGTAYIDIVLGTGGLGSTKRANQSGPSTIDPVTGTTSLTFTYTVVGGDKDIDGVSISTDALGGTITDVVGNPADSSHDAMADDIDHMVDGGNWPGHQSTNAGGGGVGGGGVGGDGVGGLSRDEGGSGGAGSSGRIRVERIGGVDRYETAKLIAERYVREVARDTSLPYGMRRVETVIIASGRAFPDALTASALAGTLLSPVALTGPALAGAHNAPLLLVEPHDMTEFTRQFLIENKIKHVYIVGGPDAVSTDVEAAIAALPSVTGVMRFGGADRYDTSVSISSEVIAMMGGAAKFCGTSLRTALLATGTDFADALALAPIAAKGPHPLLLTLPDELPDSVQLYFEAALATGSIEQIIVAGGPSAVSDDVIDELTTMGFRVVRIGGVDRYDTAIRIARYALGSGVHGHGTCLDNNRVGLATGVVYADGLAGGPLLALLDGASVLLEPDALPRVVGSFLGWPGLDHQDLTLTVFGGPEALSYHVVRLAREAAERGLP